MKISVTALSLIFLATTLNAADSNQIDADLAAIDSSFRQLRQSCAKFSSCSQGINQVGSEIQTANTDCGRCTVFDSTTSQRFITYMNNTLEPDVRVGFNAVKAQKAQANALGARDQYKSSLTTCRGDANNYLGCLVSKTSPNNINAMNAQKANILRHFDDAINYFSS